MSKRGYVTVHYYSMEVYEGDDWFEWSRFEKCKDARAAAEIESAGGVTKGVQRATRVVRVAECRKVMQEFHGGTKPQKRRKK